MKVAATGSVVTGLRGITLAQERQEFRFGGEIDGWMGQAPASIEGQTNPTLELRTGEEYAITWENVDGLPHNIAILDREGNTLERTEIISERGATQTLPFTAGEAMAEYYCEVHPTSMRGQIRFAQETATPTEADGQERIIPRGASIGVEEIASGFVQPVDLATPPGAPDRRFILDQVGQIYVHGPDGLQDEPFMDISEKLVNVGGRQGSDFDERGVLGIAFHPDFEENRLFYLRYSSPPREGTPEDYDHTHVVSEFQASQDLSRGLIDSERVLIESPSPQFNHNGGTITFGPDGYLYFGLGDGGDADDTGLGHVEDWYDENEGGNGQNTTENLLGGILRIDVDTQTDDRPYGIPDDNPFVDNDQGLPEYYAWGFRNPWRIGFSNGQLFAGDNGQNLFEEVNLVERGGNYGWNVKEGTHCFSTANPNQPPEDCPDSTPDDVRGGEPLLDPVIEYPHTQDGQAVGVSVIGGYIYERDDIPDVGGKYVFADYSQTGADPAGRIIAATPPGMGTETETPTGDGDSDLWELEELVVDTTESGRVDNFITGVARDGDGALYVLGSESGRISGEAGVVFRIVPPGEGEAMETPTETEEVTTETEQVTETEQAMTETETESE